MGLVVEEYLREDGSNPYKRGFDSLDAHAAAKVTTAKLRLELGNTSSIEWFGGLGECMQRKRARQRAAGGGQNER